MSSNSVPLHLQRNEDYRATVTLTDSEGVALDLTGHTFDMKIKQAAGSPVTVLDLDTETDGAITGIKLLTPLTAGQIQITIKEADLDAGITTAAIGNTHGVTALAYDLLMTDPESIKRCIMRGPFKYEPGVT